MKTFTKRLRHLSFLSLIAAMIAVVSFPTNALAAITDGRGSYGDCGVQMMRVYFANICGTPYTDANGDDGFVMPRRDVNGDGALDMAMYGISTKLQLYNYLTGSTGLGAAAGQPRIGAAFIIHTMLGRSGDQANANGGKTISAADRTTLYQALVQNNDIVMTLGSYSNRYNSGSRIAVSGGVGYIDESFFDSAMGGGSVYNVPSVILTKQSTGQIVYVLERLCANPMGWGMAGLDLPWATEASADIIQQNPATGATIGGPYTDVANAVPGQQYAFRYSLENIGPSRTARTIYIQKAIDTFSAATYGSYAPYTSRPPGYGSGSYLMQNSIVQTTGIIPPSAGGQKYCVAMRSSPSSMIDSGWLYSPQPRCVFVPYNYSLRGSTTPSPGAIAAGDIASYSHTMTNSAPSGVVTISEPTTYAIMQAIVPPTGTIDLVNYHDGGPGAGGVGSSVCVGWITGACATNIYVGPSAQYNSGTVSIAGGPALTAAQTNLAPGTRICRLVVIAKAAPGVTNRWDAPRCATIGKKPYTTIMNGDGWAGGSFQAVNATCSATGAQAGGFRGDYTTYSLDGNEYGSFGEYQLFAIGTISSFGSAGRPATAAGAQSTNMTYKGPATLGQFYTGPTSSITTRCMNDALKYYSTASATPIGSGSIVPASLASGTYLRTGDLTIDSGADITAGKRIVIIVTGKVTINGNVQFASGPYVDVAEIPSFTLIAAGVAAANNNIEVRNGVTRLDGVYQTYDGFLTCYEIPYTGGIGLDAGVCQDQLVLNGSVSANRFTLRRIRGADPAPALRNIPAEVFNLRSDVYLSAYGDAKGGRQIRTVSEQELPPRY